ncbi:MAG: hypothetical protein ACE5G7_03000 [Candidatus Hydrothermarchaeaceae archaeon]
MLAALPLLGLLYRFTDELAEGGSIGLLMGALCGLLTGYLISANYPAALMLGGVLVGLLLADRFNTTVHRIGLGTAILAVLYLGTPIVPPVPTIILALASFGDQQLGGVRQPYSIFADTNIVLNVFLVGYAALGILTLNSIAAFILAELTYLLGGTLFGHKKGKRYSPGIGR